MKLSKKNQVLNKPTLSTMSKKVFLAMLTLAFFNISSAQKIDWGAKAGLNYNFGGDLSEVIEEAGNSIENLISGADAKAGFHVGLWTKIDVLGLYIRPELVYTQLNNTYNNSTENVDTDFKTSKIDIPLLVGAKIAGPLHIFGGPSFQYITTSDFSQNEFQNIDKNDFTAGLQLGAGLELGKLGIDIRWEKGFSNDVNGEFANTGIRVDNRPNQIIFGLSYRFNERD